MPLFRKPPPQDPLVVSMTGARRGQRVLAVVGDARTFMHVALRVGLTGRVFALVDSDRASRRIEALAAKEGVLVDTARLAASLPLPDGDFDLAMVDDRRPRRQVSDTAALLPEIARVLRPGGRIVVLARARASPFTGLFGRRPPDPGVSPLLRALAAGSFTAERLLGVREGIAFVEAAKSGRQDPD